VITARNISSERISGYSVIITDEKKIPPEKINLKTNIVSIKGLKNGKYTIGARLKYDKLSGNKRIPVWTETVYSSFSIVSSVGKTPFDMIYSIFSSKAKSHSFTVTLFMILFAISVIYMGY